MIAKKSIHVALGSQMADQQSQAIANAIGWLSLFALWPWRPSELIQCSTHSVCLARSQWPLWRDVLDYWPARLLACYNFSGPDLHCAPIVPKAEQSTNKWAKMLTLLGSDCTLDATSNLLPAGECLRPPAPLKTGLRGWGPTGGRGQADCAIKSINQIRRQATNERPRTKSNLTDSMVAICLMRQWAKTGPGIAAPTRQN